MNFRTLLPLVITVFVASGCGQKDPTSATPAATASAPAAAVKAPAAGPRTVEITANDQMKFSLTTIEAKAGEDLKVVLTNLGTMPKEAMGHNWVLLKKGADVTAFATAAMTARETEYIPAGLKDQVLAHTELIGPRKSSEASFKVPSEPGEYPFLCSFPAHFLTGMKGVLVVK